MKTTKGDKSIGFIAPVISWATRAVIGTLRPTEQRRAMLCQSHNVELRGIEPLTSAVRLQRSTN